jgi:hypothetical protein
MTNSSEQRALCFIATCPDSQKLKQVAANARSQGSEEVEKAALLRLYAVLPSSEPGTLEHDVWQSVYALEGALKTARGKTTLLARTRQKLAKDGELKTVCDLVTGKSTAGFQMLLDRGMPELTFEAVALRHKDRFDHVVLEAAKERLGAAGVG